MARRLPKRLCHRHEGRSLTSRLLLAAMDHLRVIIPAHPRPFHAERHRAAVPIRGTAPLTPRHANTLAVPPPLPPLVSAPPRRRVHEQQHVVHGLLRAALRVARSRFRVRERSLVRFTSWTSDLGPRRQPALPGLRAGDHAGRARGPVPGARQHAGRLGRALLVPPALDHRVRPPRAPPAEEGAGEEGVGGPLMEKKRKN